jgi:cell wall-associated NlpC family hydrolase
VRTHTGKRIGTTGLAGLLVICLSGSVALVAHADPTPPVVPSKSDVDAARQAAAAKAAQVSAIETRLAGATDRLEALGQQAGRAAEAYNGAVYQLRQAQAEAAAAAARAGKAQQTLAQQRRRIGLFAVASYQGGGELARIGPLFTADGPQELLDSAGAAKSVSTAMQGSYLRFTATQVVANAFKMQAEDALARVRAATEAAAVAKSRAEAAVRAQSAAVASMGTDRRRMIGQLAALRQTSYQVAEQRQRGLEELARQRAAAAAARRAEQLRKRAAERAAAEAAQRATEAAEEARRQADKARAERARKAAERAAKAAEEAKKAATRKEQEEARRRAEQAADEAEREARKRKKKDPDTGGTRSGAGRAIDFARAQIGEPYVWAAAGPDSWDCSGLTMRAWAKSGVSLPHYSVAQYEQSRKIEEDELRPGDLVFWADDAGDPGTIFHVGLYIGGGEMIHAPRPGASVRTDSIYYWEDPDFFGRP